MSERRSSNPTVRVEEKSGWLMKKSPAGVKGFRHWQKRWFVFTRKNKESSSWFIRYYKQKEDTEPLFTIHVNRIVKAQYLPGKRTGCRFDIKMDNSRIYALDASSKKEAKQWVELIQAAMALRDKKVNVMASAAAGDGIKWTKLQDLFFTMRYPPHVVDPRTDEEKSEHAKAIAEMNSRFSSNTIILKFILEHVIDPEERGVETAASIEAMDSTNPRSPVIAGHSRSLSSMRSRASFSALSLGPSLMSPSSAATTAEGKESKENKAPVKPVNEQHIAKLKRENNYDLYQNLRKGDFSRNLLMLFSKKDTVVHNLAIRVLWFILKNNSPPSVADQQFADNVRIFCADTRFNASLKNGLFALLFQAPADIVKNLDDTVKVAFFKPIVHKEVLRALFYALKGCDFELRRSTLEDLNTTLIGSPNNCAMVQEQPNWQELVWDLLTDIPKDKQEEKAKKVYGYAMNVFAVLNFQAFQTDSTFYPLVCSTMDSLFLFSGSSHQTWDVGRVILLSILNKLKSSKKVFQSTDDHTTIVWKNLMEMVNLVIKFVFQTVHWKSDSNVLKEQKALDEKLKEEGKEGKENKEEKAESPVVRAAHHYILTKARVGSNSSFVPFHEAQEFGVHFSESGKAGDIKLMATLISFYDMLHLDNFDAESSGNLNAEDVKFLKQAVHDYAFFKDCVSLLEMLHRSSIDDGRITWRKIADLVRRNLEARKDPSARKAIREECQVILSKDGAIIPSSKPGKDDDD